MFGYHSDVGRRPAQQDSVCMAQYLTSNCFLFGVFDGHGSFGGSRCSKLASKTLHSFIGKHLTSMNFTPEEITQSVTEGFKDFDNFLSTLPRRDPSIKTKWSWLFGPPDASFRESGSCACILITSPKYLVIANLGDSRAILSNGKRISNDHRCSNPQEFKRLHDADGWVYRNRIFGRLIPTRTFGDHDAKKIFKDAHLALSNEPEVHVLSLNSELPEFVLLVCDGITDVLSDEKIAALCESNSKLHPDEIAQIITEAAFEAGSKDNLTCIVVRCKPSSNIFKVSETL